MYRLFQCTLRAPISIRQSDWNIANSDSFEAASVGCGYPCIRYQAIVDESILVRTVVLASSGISDSSHFVLLDPPGFGDRNEIGRGCKCKHLIFDICNSCHRLGLLVRWFRLLVGPRIPSTGVVRLLARTI